MDAEAAGAKRKGHLFVVEQDQKWLEELEAQAGEHGIPTLGYGLLTDAMDTLKSEKSIALVLGDSKGQNLTNKVTRIRDDEDLSGMPVIGFVKDQNSEDLKKAFEIGLDDFVAHATIQSFSRKLSALLQEKDWDAVRAPSGTALLASSDRIERISWARILRRIGFDVHFASDQEEFSAGMDGSRSFRIVISNEELWTQKLGEKMQQAFSKEDVSVSPMIILHNGSGVSGAAASLTGHPKVAAFNKKHPAENANHVINRLMAPPQSELRRSPRLNYSVPVSYRIGDSAEDLLGYSWNINKTGIFIRTLNPAPAGSALTMEFRPPSGRGTVIVEGQSVWCQRLGLKRMMFSPSGMGVVFTKVPLADSAALEAGYNELLRISYDREGA